MIVYLAGPMRGRPQHNFPGVGLTLQVVGLAWQMVAS